MSEVAEDYSKYNNWRVGAACYEDPDFSYRAMATERPLEKFFKGDTTGPNGENGYTKQAREACNACPVQAACLQEAFDNKEEYGIWGGHTTYQRKQILRKRGQLATRLTVVEDIA